MPGPKPPQVTLTDIARQGLEKLVKARSTPQHYALRARIILFAAQGMNNAEIARQLDVSLDAVRLWRQRWLDLQPVLLNDLSITERLADLPRPGTPPRITADQLCQIENLACEKPEQSGRPISQWTGREVADEIRKRGIVAKISPRHAARLLEKKASSHT
jgi:putative transposase